MVARITLIALVGGFSLNVAAPQGRVPSDPPSWCWGRISTPWWSFNPHQAEYVNLGSPVVERTNQDSRKEFYFWLGASAKYRFYNAILQGQVRESVVTFGRSELEHVIGETWMGVTKEFGSGWRGSFFIRGRTEEIKGPKKR